MNGPVSSPQEREDSGTFECRASVVNHVSGTEQIDMQVGAGFESNDQTSGEAARKAA